MLDIITSHGGRGSLTLYGWRTSVPFELSRLVAALSYKIPQIWENTADILQLLGLPHLLRNTGTVT